MQNFKLICCIVNSGQGSRVLGTARLHGVRGGTICMGRGTAKSRLLALLDLTDIKKEIVFIMAEQEVSDTLLKALNKQVTFQKRNHGIAFSVLLKNHIGTKQSKYNKINKKVADEDMHNAIFTVVDKGMAEDVVEAAVNAGARGGTIINARGSGINETRLLFAMPVEPEKEVVMIVAKNGITPVITEAIKERVHIDEAGNGILFVIELNEVCGLVDL